MDEAVQMAPLFEAITRKVVERQVMAAAEADEAAARECLTRQVAEEIELAHGHWLCGDDSRRLAETAVRALEEALRA